MKEEIRMYGSTRLHTRIKRLERNALDATEPVFVQYVIVDPDPVVHLDNALRRIEGAGREWLRAPGETEQGFIDRAFRDMREMRPAGFLAAIGYPNCELELQ